MLAMKWRVQKIQGMMKGKWSKVFSTGIVPAVTFGSELHSMPPQMGGQGAQAQLPALEEAGDPGVLSGHGLGNPGMEAEHLDEGCPEPDGQIASRNMAGGWGVTPSGCD